MQPSIVDHDGRSYSISVSNNDAVSLFKVYDRETLVGEARCVRKSQAALYLSDIAIANHVVRSKSQPRSIDYRGRGLGSALLQFLISYARDLGVQQLYGNVFRQDVQNNPNLLQWYEKHGFEIQPVPAENEDEDIVAIICLRL